LYVEGIAYSNIYEILLKYIADDLSILLTLLFLKIKRSTLKTEQIRKSMLKSDE